MSKQRSDADLPVSAFIDMPIRLRNALTREWGLSVKGVYWNDVPRQERPDDVALLGWAGALTDRDLLRIRNFGRGCLKWVRDNPVAAHPYRDRLYDDDVLSAYSAGYADGRAIGSALGAASVIGAAFQAGVEWHGESNGSLSARTRRRLREGALVRQA